MPVWRARGNTLPARPLIADGKARDEAGAKTYAAQRTPTQLAACLREKSADELLTAVTKRPGAPGYVRGHPVPDGRVVAADPATGIRAGRYVKCQSLPAIRATRPDSFHSFSRYGPASALRRDLRAAHTFDWPFIFGNFGPSLYSCISCTPANQPGRLALSQLMMNSLGAFAQA
jgi:carboxylesterase type B